MDGVHGIVLLSEEGKVLFESLDDTMFLPEKSRLSWNMIIESLERFREMDLVFEKGRFYIRKTEGGYLMISMGRHVSIAMVKLNCDILVPELTNVKPDKGLKKFFKF